MRLRNLAKVHEYLLIGGYSAAENDRTPRILLARGNGYREEIVEVIERMPFGTKYAAICERANDIAKQRGIRCGRRFTDREWLGPTWEEHRAEQASNNNSD